MSKANVIFTLEGNALPVQCTTEDKIKDICQRYSTKVEANLKSLLFLYGGSQLNFELKFKEQANSCDKVTNEMKVLVYKTITDEFICPKCGEKTKFNIDKIDELISSNKNISDNIDGTKLIIENMIKNSTINSVNIQLKNINLILNTINEDIKKNNQKLKNLLNDIVIVKTNINNMNNNMINNINIGNDNNTNVNNNNEIDINNNIINNNIINNGNNINNHENKNIIKGILNIQLSKIDNNITLFKTNIEDGIDVYLNNEKINMVIDNGKWIIDYNFKKDGKYKFEIIFTNTIDNMEGFFEEGSHIISLDLSSLNSSKVTNMRCLFNKCNALEYLDLSNIDTSNVIDMGFMFNECSKLQEIKGINQLITNKVIKMDAMFQECNELKLLDLSNFNTCNVTNMGFMFNNCKKLKEIKGINKFITNKVTDMDTMFNSCCELESLDLSSFDTSNVIDMSRMFNECNKLKYLNLLNFTINCETEDMFSFPQKDRCKLTTNNKDLIKLYNS